jgi:hypothetical protein
MTSTPSSKPCTETAIVRTLLASIVDYAGLFPPARLDVEAAAAAFQRYRAGGHAWLLGGFVVPAERLDELADAVRGLRPSEPWPVSVIVGSPEEAVDALEWARRHAVRLSVKALEVRPMAAEEIVAARPAPWAATEGIEIYHEVPLDDDTEARLDALAVVGAAAKLRTGGLTSASTPARGAVVRFMSACRERGLAFKATAGLHHAFPGSYPLTYEPDSACGMMHGFLGVALVAALVHEGAVSDTEASELLGGDARALEVGAEALRWHGRTVSEAALVRARAGFFRSFGSCSFEEPVEELVAAGLL